MILREIAEKIAGELSGNPDLEISGLSTIDQAKAGDIIFVLSDKYLASAQKSAAGAAVIKEGQKIDKPSIAVSNPRSAMAKLLDIFSRRSYPKPGVHKSAVIEESAEIGKSVAISPFVYIGENCTVGDNSILYPNVTIYDNVTIGNNVIIHAGAVVGVDGFGFIPTAGEPVKIPQIGRVIIEDNVEIYSNTTIARGTIGDTVIKKSAKIDCVNHIAHNAEIGENTMIGGQSVIAGSTKIGKNCLIAGHSSVTDHVTIGDNSIVMGMSGVSKDLPPKSKVWGIPAYDHRQYMRDQAKLRRLLKKS